MNNYMIKIALALIVITNCHYVFAYDINALSEQYHAYGKQQIKSKDSKGNTIFTVPDYESYADRNNNVSEKIVAIYDKRSPAYGYRYVLYTPIGRYVGHHKIVQQSPNGYGYAPIPDGGEGSLTPCFKTIKEAKHYYYPQWY